MERVVVGTLGMVVPNPWGTLSPSALMMEHQRGTGRGVKGRRVLRGEGADGRHRPHVVMGRMGMLRLLGLLLLVMVRVVPHAGWRMVVSVLHFVVFVVGRI